MRLKEERAMALLASRGVPQASFPAAKEGQPAGPEVEGSLLVALDPASHKVLLLLTRRRVEDWRAFLEAQPREAAREYLEAGERGDRFLGRELARRAGFQGADQTRLEKLVLAAHALLEEHDGLWVDLRFCRSGEVFRVWKAEMEVDDEALFRHPELEGAGEEKPPEELSERERAARKAGVSYMDLDGDIGLLPGGMGFALAALDIVRSVGGEPANLMESGGEATPERIAAMMDLLLDNPRVVAVLGCRWAGLTRADDWARLMVQYILDKKPSKPLVLRVAGNNEAEARRIFEEAAEKHPADFQRVWVFYSNTPVDNVAREVVALRDMLKRGEDPFGEAGGGARPAEMPGDSSGAREARNPAGFAGSGGESGAGAADGPAGDLGGDGAGGAGADGGRGGGG